MTLQKKLLASRVLPVVTAGNVSSTVQLARALQGGGMTAIEITLRTAAAEPLDFVPGVASASEVMSAMYHGFSICKLFPATTLGGESMLKSLGGPFPDVLYCPTGGLNPTSYRQFLALPNVICCGGSWMVAAELVDNGRWDYIEELAREAMPEH
jgi:2-dehydro-3-deoxyphosphogluconate aldolase/(4S)-4-hydroxy-2-oxoglutarate aldolase